jgi:probable HAF family extracellular repeat protein
MYGPSTSTLYPVYWDQDGVHVIGDTHGQAYGVNNSGTIVGTHNGYPFIWDASSGLRRIEGLGFGEARKVNNRGDVVGYAYIENTPYAFFWNEATGVTLLGAGSIARGLNDRREVIIDVNVVQVQVWSALSGFRSVPALVETPSLHIALDINNRGQVVGYSDSDPAPYSGEWHAFLYENDTTIDLNSWLELNSDWVLRMACGINDAGQIVGFGYNRLLGGGRGFLLDRRISNDGAVAANN